MTVIALHVDPRLRCPCGRTLQSGDLHAVDGVVRISCPRCDCELIGAIFPADAEFEFDFTPHAEEDAT